METENRWIVVRHWERFQHYKNREVPWIKAYTELNSDQNYLDLSFHARGVLHGLWAEYARARCQLRDNTHSLSRRLGHRVTRDTIESLNHAGFIEFSSSPNLEHVLMHSRHTRAREEEEKIEEKSKRRRTSSRGESSSLSEGTRYTQSDDATPDNGASPTEHLTPDPEGIKRVASLMHQAAVHAHDDDENPYKRNPMNPEVELTDEQRKEIEVKKEVAKKRLKRITEGSA